MSANIVGQQSARPALDRRLEGIGWALFLIMIGGIGLIHTVPPGTWLVRTGLIMLGLNVARSVNGIRMSNVTLVLGVLALLLGIGGMTGVDLPFFPLLLILIGADLLFKVATRNEQAVKPEATVETVRQQ
jgi:hypothetical protein